MNDIFSLQQASQTGTLAGKLITRQYKLDMRARFLEINSVNPRLRQEQIAKKLRMFKYYFTTI